MIHTHTMLDTYGGTFERMCYDCDELAIVVEKNGWAFLRVT